MKVFGLIGFPLSHSFSKKYFTEKFLNDGISDHRYELFSLESINDFQNLIISNQNLAGLNVTIPHKVNVIPYLNDLDEAAQEIGAVNCIRFIKIGEELILKGYNTDAYGFEYSLKPLLTTEHNNALIFGDGGAAKAVKYVLSKLNINYKTVVRNPTPGAILYSEVSPEILQSHKLLINTTPLGMLPNTNTFPEIDYTCLSNRHLAYDLVYNPLETAFLLKAAQQGAVTKNGLEMLHQQAEKAWEIWNS